MEKKKTGEGAISLLRSSIAALFTHRVIFYPFVVIAFIQFLILEALYFFPRYPLNKVFGPIVSKLWAPEFMHYPNNFLLLPKLFQYSQMPVYVLITSFFIAIAIIIIKNINDDETVTFKSAVAEAWSVYVHVVVAAAISFFFVWIFFYFYGQVYDRALMIRSQSGPFYLLKQVIIQGAPYFNLIWSIMVTTLMAYVLPIIVIERKKVFAAIWHNLKMVFSGFWVTFLIVLLPSLLFLPILWVRGVLNVNQVIPEFSVFTLVASIFITVFIDAVMYTTLTSRYLWKIEQR